MQGVSSFCIKIWKLFCSKYFCSNIPYFDLPVSATFSQERLILPSRKFYYGVLLYFFMKKYLQFSNCFCTCGRKACSFVCQHGKFRQFKFTYLFISFCTFYYNLRLQLKVLLRLVEHSDELKVINSWCISILDIVFMLYVFNRLHLSFEKNIFCCLVVLQKFQFWS